MISLVLQFKLIFFSFIFGFLFSALLEWFNKKIVNINTYLKLLYSVLLVISMTFIYFVGIQKIGNAIFHIYSIISIVVGFVLYDIFRVLRTFFKSGAVVVFIQDFLYSFFILVGTFIFVFSGLLTKSFLSKVSFIA